MKSILLCTMSNTDESIKALRFNTVKPVFSSHSKVDKTKILLKNGSLMKVKMVCDNHVYHQCWVDVLVHLCLWYCYSQKQAMGNYKYNSDNCM